VIKSKETPSGLGAVICDLIPGFSLRSNPGLKLANAFGVFVFNLKLMHYLIMSSMT